MQAERTSLLDVLKANNIERPPMPDLPPEPVIEPPPKSADKLDIMSRNCSELKKTLAVLQGQMNALTAEKVTKDTAVTENIQPKKSKNKKNKANKSCPIKERVASGTDVAVYVNSSDEPIEAVVSTNSENTSAVTESSEESVNTLETEVVERAEESTVSGQQDQTTEIIKDLVDDVNDIQINCSLESQNDNDKDNNKKPELVVNGDNDGVASTPQESIDSEATITPSVAKN